VHNVHSFFFFCSARPHYAHISSQACTVAELAGFIFYIDILELTHDNNLYTIFIALSFRYFKTRYVYSVQ